MCGQHLLGEPSSPASAPRRGATPAATPGDSNLAWWVAGASLVALILIAALPILRREGGDEAAEQPPPAVGPVPPDLTSMTPREAADRLFTRVMTAAERGDSSEVRSFLPMAIAAYDQARPLNLDGLFHLSLLQRTSGDLTAALATARDGLAQDPDNLLSLSAAAEAARGLDDVDAARRYYDRFLQVYERERAKALPDYEAHSELLERFRDTAAAAGGS